MIHRLQGALKIQDTLEKHLGIHIGETTKVRSQHGAAWGSRRQGSAAS